MKKTIKKKWLKALRSGDFEQCAERLVNNGRYCCLGVLRYLNNPHDGSSAIDPYHSKISGGMKLSQRQLAEFGLSDNDQLEAVTMNDKGRSFLEIADWIEEAL